VWDLGQTGGDAGGFGGSVRWGEKASLTAPQRAQLENFRKMTGKIGRTANVALENAAG